MRSCAECGAGATQRCGGCGNVSYCGAAHQVHGRMQDGLFAQGLAAEETLAGAQAAVRTLQDREEQGRRRRQEEGRRKEGGGRREEE